jgi:hypothetical protein
MGHAIHFLERLERLSMPQADVALGLYRDPELVRFLLSCIKLSDGVERVALALEHGPDTPHVILARDGGFVTCLGQGMSVGDHVVVTRERLERLSAEHAEVRSAVEHMRQGRNSRQLYHRLYRGGPTLAREDIRTLRALYPLYWSSLFESTVGLAQSLQQFRSAYRRSYYRRKNSDALEKLELYWQATWALANLVVLFGSVLRQFLDKGTIRIENMGLMGLASLTVNNHSTPLVLRGAWAVARAGHHLLPAYKRSFESNDDYLVLFDSVVALCAMGLRHRKLRGEVRKILARRRNPVLAGAAGSHPIQSMLPRYERVMDDEEPTRLLHRLLGACMVVGGDASRVPEDPTYADKLMAVPDELAFVILGLADTCLLRDQDALALLPLMLPWLASADIEDLYLPAATLATIDLAFQPDLVLDQLDDIARYARGFQPVRREATPGRNEPCSCGSGKKYKRCCGAAAG